MAGYNLRTTPKATPKRAKVGQKPRTLTASSRYKVGQKAKGISKPTGKRRAKPRQIMGGTVVGLSGGVGNLRSVAQAVRQTMAQAAPILAHQSGAIQNLKGVASRKPKVRKSGTTYTPTTKRK